jgi:hypothetical protein
MAPLGYCGYGYGPGVGLYFGAAVGSAGVISEAVITAPFFGGP